MTPGEMLAALDDAIADSPWWWPWGIALELRYTRVLLDERGRRLADEDGTPVYGFTRSQCKRMRAAIEIAARGDAGLA